MLAMACSPEEHCRFVVEIDVVWGMLTDRAAMRNDTAEVGGDRTLPTHISCMDEGDTRKSSLLTPCVGSLSNTPCRTVERRVAGGY